MTRTILFPLSLALLLSSAQAGTVILYDNFSGGYRTTGWHSVYAEQNVALSFLPTVDATLKSVELPLSKGPESSPFVYYVRLLAANPSDPSLPIDDPVCEWTNLSGGELLLEPAAPVALQSGKSYFISVGSPSTRYNDNRGWYTQQGEVRGSIAAGSGSNWYVANEALLPAMRVIGETSAPAVPEPATLALGVLGLSLAARRRRR